MRGKEHIPDDYFDDYIDIFYDHESFLEGVSDNIMSSLKYSENGILQKFKNTSFFVF